MRNIRLTVLDSTLVAIREWADEDGITRGQLVDRAVSYYTTFRHDQDSEREKDEPS